MVRSGDPQIRSFLTSPPAPGFYHWYNGNLATPTFDSPISRAFHICNIPSVDQVNTAPTDLSFGDASDHRSSPLRDLTIFDTS